MALYHFKRIVRDSEGDAVASVEVTVKQAGTETNATIYSDSAGTGKANPFTSDADGRYDFWVDEGAEIDLDFSKTGFTISSEDGITIPWITTSAPSTRTISTTSPITGGGDLSADRTFAFDDSAFVLLAGRAGGQTILQALTVEGGFVVNDLGAAVNFRVEGDTDASALVVQGSTNRVGIGTDSPSNDLHIRKSGSVFVRIESADTGATQFIFADANQDWRFGKASDDTFTVTDNTGSTIPVRITNTAPTNSLRIESDGSVGLGTTANASAALDVGSTSKGLLLPRLTTSQRDAIASPANGLIIYNSTTNKVQARAAGAWVDLH